MDAKTLVWGALLVATIIFLATYLMPTAKPFGFGEMAFASALVGAVCLAAYFFGLPGPRSAASPSRQPSQTVALSSAQLELLRKSTLGAVVVAAPASAVQYRPFAARLALAPGFSAERVEASILRGTPGSEILREERVWIAPVMEAGVQGAGFEFVTKPSYAQPVAAKEPTVWTWQIVPVEAGPLNLEFRISGKFKVQEEVLQRDLFSRSFLVKVDVNPEGFFKRHWEKLLTMVGAAVTALVGGIWAYVRWWKPSPDSSPIGSRAKAKYKR